MPTAPEILPTATIVARAQHAIEVALQLGVPERELEAERHRLGVHAVRAADHRRAPVLLGARAHRLHQRRRVLERSGRRPRASAAPARCRRRRTRSGRSAASAPPGPTCSATAVVNAMTSCCVICSISSMRAMSKAALLAQLARGLGRHDARLGHRVGRRELHLEPGLVAALLAPDRAHLGVGVAANHRVSCVSSSASRVDRASRLRRSSERRRSHRSRAERSVRRTDRAATRWTSSAVTPLDAGERLVEAEVPVEVDLLPRQVRHAARRCSRGSASGCPSGDPWRAAAPPPAPASASCRAAPRRTGR